jgi:chromosome partitioning protein
MTSRKPLKVVAVTGQKGGVGKSMLSRNLSVEAAASGETVVLIDIDPQCNTADWGDRRQPDPAQREDANPVVLSAQPARLKHVLDAAGRAGATLAIIDTPPKNADAVVDALTYADLALLPLRPEIDDVGTLPAVMKSLSLANSSVIRRNAAQGPVAAFVVWAQCPAQGSYEVEAEAYARALTETKIGTAFEQFCPVRICLRRDYPNAAVPGLAASEYAPRGKAAQEIRDLYKFVCKQLKLNSKTMEKINGAGPASQHA